MKKKVVSHINDSLSDFSYSSDESDEKYIFENIFFEEAISKESNKEFFFLWYTS